MIAARFGVAISERSVGLALNARGYRRLTVRPRRPKADEAAAFAFWIAPRESPARAAYARSLMPCIAASI